MSVIVVIIHIIVCLALIMIVLLQTGKGADMGAAFGGGGSQTLFGSSGASTFLSKATTIAAVIFMITCFTLAYMSTHKTPKSIIKEEKAPIAQEEKKPSELPVDQGTTAPISQAQDADMPVQKQENVTEGQQQPPAPGNPAEKSPEKQPAEAK